MKQSQHYHAVLIWFLLVSIITIIFILKTYPNTPIHIFYTALFIGLGLLIHFKK